MGRSRFRSKKSWGRGKPFRVPNKLLLIVCEGRRTEPNYFHSIRREKRLSMAHIEIVPGSICGTDPDNIVRYAIKEQKRRRKDEMFDEVWCVFDRDDHLNIPTAFDLARRSRLNLAFSNPSFELWFLLHFEEQTAYITRDQVITNLKRHIPRYTKSMEGVYGLVSGQLNTAILRCQNLRDMHRRNGNLDTRNPSSRVDELVVTLNSVKLNP